MNKEYSKFEIAENQLKTAISICVSDGDLFCSATLAGVADVIFSQLVSREGKQNFTEYSLEESIKMGGNNQTVKEHGKEINDALQLNQIRHMDEGDDGFITLNLEETAVGSIAKALANYDMLPGRDRALINVFLMWSKKNLDPSKYDLSNIPEWIPEKDDES